MKPANKGRAARTTPTHRTNARRVVTRSPVAVVIRICMTRAPGVCPVLDQKATK
jgi:hypothetical protein